MKLILKNDYDDMSRGAALIVKQRIAEKPNIVLGLSTGHTPFGLYEELVRMHTEEGLDFSQVVTFNLDEYIGLDSDNPKSYYFFMHENLFSKINILKENALIPYGMVRNLEKHCEWYKNTIKAKGGIDLMVLGIGGNGHIGFNEPGSSFDSITRVVDLSEKTRKDNSRFFDSIDDVPKQAITMGIATIMASEECLLLASGRNKTEIIKKALHGSVTEEVPASVLQNHPNLTVILDHDAAGKDD